VLTAEFGDLMTRGDDTFRNAMLELSLLTVLALVWALVLVRRRAPGAAAEKA